MMTEKSINPPCGVVALRGRERNRSMLRELSRAPSRYVFIAPARSFHGDTHALMFLTD
jgi:hypothetical protein